MPNKNVVHPGEMLLEECLKPLGLTITAAAKHIGVSRNALSELINGETSLSRDMAIRLTKAFGSDERMWMGLQFDYDMAHIDEYRARFDIPKITEQHFPL